MFCWCPGQFLRKLIRRTVEPQLQGQAQTQSPASLFNYLKSKTARLRVCENPVSLAAAWRSDILQGQPCLSASVRLAPALGSFLSGGIVWKRVWSGIWGSCQCAVSLLSPSGLPWQIHLIFFFFFFLMNLKDWLFDFILWPCSETLSLSTATDINQWRTDLP